MRIAITGGRGQLGQELARVLREQHDIVVLDLPEYDVTRRNDIARLADARPEVVIHCAAMTDVDGCARDPVAAFRVNTLGAHNVALACQRANAAMLYISTNEVFDGTQQTPYLEWDAPRAINPYGASKLAGERMVQMLLTRLYIVRTAWLYSLGRHNFVAKVLARAQGQRTLAYVDDELGNPTYAPDLARAIAALIETEHYGIYHLVNEGVTSRYDWAARILHHAGLNDVTLTRTKLAEFKRDSTPPLNGALTNFVAAHVLGIRLRAWQDALAEYFSISPKGK